jgi:signal transduction histidine kinase
MTDDRTVAARQNVVMTGFSDARSWRARAVAFARAAEPRAELTGRAAALDALLAFATAVASLTAVINDLGYREAPVVLAALPAVLITTLPLAMRRIFPISVFWIILGGIVFENPYANTVTFVALVLAAYSAVAHSRFRGAAVISVLLAGLMVTAAYPDTAPPLPGRFTALLILVPVVLVGNAVSMWQRRAGDSQEQLARAQADHEAATLRALAAERSRIASELHDVVTHNVSVMVVQAGAARRVLAGSPDDAKEALLAVEASGRAAMVELQHLLGLLAPVEGMAPQAGLDEALLRPQPGLGQLPSLVERVAAAGLVVELATTGEPRPLPPGLDLTAYRVVQEALTNIMKHAGPAKAVVRLDYRDDAVVIDISDDGRGAHQTAPAQLAGNGRGLLGLHERLSLYGGELDVGPRPAGGWRVTARLPDRSPEAA